MLQIFYKKNYNYLFDKSILANESFLIFLQLLKGEIIKVDFFSQQINLNYIILTAIVKKNNLHLKYILFVAQKNNMERNITGIHY